ncbi:hypothetical protein N866_18110 [Actinotalea ferrariae CF5-4]|uniref:DUF427 domain-containing protein n=1 Tax=Actinotalea ferrariae CF5-4 TaxID=948458 RepID=A0A021VXJ2_9CELL|nr:DUF427 domain-containing protein [Actinotalea ferrariae]EYR63812.1 hypothetical protein N866_18110 [Actinotalea ferrariae CF5-4]
MRAVWNGTVIAESEDTVVVEGNHYFPAQSVDPAVLRPSGTRTVCSWKGTASYWTLEVDGRTNPDAAWYYPEPKPDAEHVRDRVAFWRGVTVEG